MVHARTTVLDFEALEERSMFAVAYLGNGMLYVTGTNGDDTIHVSLQGSDFQVIDNGVTSVFSADWVAITALRGDDTITVDDNVPCWINGGKGNDTLRGGSGSDVIFGGNGKDTIYGGAGEDKLFGGRGKDIIYGELGSDQAAGGSGNDIIYGGDDRDTLFGEAGNDKLYGELGADSCDGGSGNDRLEGGALNDWLYGGNGIDFLLGGEDDDYLIGEAGRDSCYGGGGNDAIKGGAGKDVIDGETGNNMLDPDQGFDFASNGIIVDLDKDISWLRRYSPVSSSSAVTVTYKQSNENGILTTKLYVSSVYTLPGDGPYDIVVNGHTIGQLQTDRGVGGIIFSTHPSVGELPFPVDFPESQKDLMIQVGPFLLSEIHLHYSQSLIVPQLPTNFMYM
jgi:Ca2+-binding RTX toxin-like protein